MSKLTLRCECMLFYAAMLSEYCDSTFCPDCVFSNYGNVNNGKDCLLMDQGPAVWGKIIEKIRKEAADGTQEDHC